MRCPSPSGEGAVPILTITEKLLYQPPDLKLKELDNLEEGKPGNAGDDGVYWRVNLDRLHQDFR
jgi:hypothetical protein